MSQTSPILAAADAATRVVAPLWPLRHFVAVNPFLGLTGQDFHSAAAEMADLAGARTTAPREFVAAAIAEGRVSDADLAGGAAAVGLTNLGATALRQAALAETGAPSPLPTVADLATVCSATDWPVLVTERISTFAAGWFDEGQATWAASKSESLYADWRSEAILDPTPEIAGLSGARTTFAALPATAEALIEAAPERLGLTEAETGRYFARLVLSIPGWAGFARYKLWQAELHGGTTPVATELLAVRLAWDLALLPVAGSVWATERSVYRETPNRKDHDIDLALQHAYETAFHREMIATFDAGAARPAPAERPQVQAAFCIDVRSEVFRRAFETAMPGAETIGFAGFFGASVDYVPLGHDQATARCPVLLTPGYTVREIASPGLAATRRGRLKAGAAWSGFKQAAVASFGFVETLGLGFGARLAGLAAGAMTPVADPRNAGLTGSEAASLAPDLSDIPETDRPKLGAFMLKGMTLTGPLARIVLLAGHGSSSANNPHATGLDCGACGGHTGEANARIASAILNDPAVRAALPDMGLTVPDDTIFVPALHNTTTDEVTLFDTAPFAATHGDDLGRLEQALSAAGRLARAERAVLLNLPDGADADAAVPARATDWSQVRPEWGLAGCAAFVAAPRSRTAGLDLKGRAFLHSYDWQADEGFGTLELIMTAPLVVASWINLQYYGSTVDNRVFGSGNKTLHNTVGLIGVFEGTGGDLRSGLPMQSVHDGERFIHEPLRLNAVIEAPEAAMTAIIAKNAGLRDLVDNGWIHLWRMDAEGKIVARYAGEGRWEPVKREPTLAEAA